MTDRFYLDTSVWLDFYLKRGKNGEIAKKLIKIIKIYFLEVSFKTIKN